MKDYYVDKQNTPKLKLYTWLIGLFYAFSGLNALLSVLGYKGTDTEISAAGWVVGILMCVMVPVAIKDKRRENRNLGAVISSGVVHLSITVFMLLFFQSSFLMVLYVAEWCICIVCIIYYHKNRFCKKKK